MLRDLGFDADDMSLLQVPSHDDACYMESHSLAKENVGGAALDGCTSTSTSKEQVKDVPVQETDEGGRSKGVVKTLNARM